MVCLFLFSCLQFSFIALSQVPWEKQVVFFVSSRQKTQKSPYYKEEHDLNLLFLFLAEMFRFCFLGILVICTLSCQKPCEALGPSANLLGSMSSSRLLSSGKLTVTPNGQWMVIGEPAHVLAE